MKCNLYYPLILIALFIQSCDGTDTSLSIQNKTGKTIYYSWSRDTIEWIYYNWKKLLNDSIIPIPQHVGGSWFYEKGSVWAVEFQYDDDHIQHLFIFFEETIRHNRDTIIGSIRDHYRYDKRIDLTLKDIKRMDWRIVVE